MRGATILLGLLCGLLIGILSFNRGAYAQPDSVRAAILEEKGYPPDHSPQGALWRSAVVPGWGQFYNRQYLKIPFVYGGLVGGGVAFYEMHNRYLLFRRANLFVVGRQQARENNGDNEYQHFEEEHNRVVQRFGGELRAQQLRERRDKYRRWRELSIVATGVFYALTILDAYVSAHLLSFNVGEDLSLDVRPVGIPRAAYTPSSLGDEYGGAESGAGLHLRLHF